MDEEIHPPRFFGRKIGQHIKGLHLASNSAGEGRGVKSGNRTNSAAPCRHIRPCLGDSIPYWGDRTKAGDYDASSRHADSDIRELKLIITSWDSQ